MLRCIPRPRLGGFIKGIANRIKDKCLKAVRMQRKRKLEVNGEEKKFSDERATTEVNREENEFLDEKSTIEVNGEDERREWVSEPDDGIFITLVSLPDGGNRIKKVRFRSELFDIWSAMNWWSKNSDKLSVLYGISPSQPRSPSHSKEFSEVVHESKQSTRGIEGKVVQWVVEDEPGVFVTIRSLPDGSRELTRVDLSREKFGEGKGKAWLMENKARLHEQYGGEAHSLPPIHQLLTLSMAPVEVAMAAPLAAAKASKTFLFSQKTRSSLSFTPNLRVPTHHSFPKYPSFSRSATEPPLLSAAPPSTVTPSSPSPTSYHGPCYVLGDNIDTDQIIPAEHLTLVPSKPDESAPSPSAASPPTLTPYPSSPRAPTPPAFRSSSRAPTSGAAPPASTPPSPLAPPASASSSPEYYAPSFFRNSVATGEIYPMESEETGIWKECTTRDIVTIDLAESRLINHTTGMEYRLKPIGDAGPGNLRLREDDWDDCF